MLLIQLGHHIVFKVGLMQRLAVVVHTARHFRTSSRVLRDVKYFNDANPYIWGTPDTGANLIHDPIFNKGTAFTPSERDRMGIRGLIPPESLSLEAQTIRISNHLKFCHSDLDKYITLMALMDRNETLYYNVIIRDIKKYAPIIYTPTVGLACQHFSSLYRRPRGMYFSLYDGNEMASMVYNWPSDNVKVVVVTDGSRILGLGDLGCQGMAIPIGKLALYIAAGGIRPEEVLPVQLDLGTNNEKLLNDPLYIGIRRNRIQGDQYMAYLDEFMQAITGRYPSAMIQFEDFATTNAYKILDRYRNKYLCFNDDIQGTGACALAGMYGALKAKGKTPSDLKDETVLCVGGGSAGTGVLSFISTAMGSSINKSPNKSPNNKPTKNIFIKGLFGIITTQNAEPHQAAFAHNSEDLPFDPTLPLDKLIDIIKPTVLLGLTGQAGVFSEDVVRAMAKHNDRPIIFPMSNPTSLAECTPEQAYNWSDGRAIVATGSPFAPFTYNDQQIEACQANNMFIFPALGLACVLAKPKVIPDMFFIIAAQVLSESLTADDIANGRVYPHINEIRNVSKRQTAAICKYAWDNNLATAPRPESILAAIEDKFYKPEYQPLVWMKGAPSKSD